MTRRDGHEVGVGWALLLAVLVSVGGVVVTIIAEAERSYLMMHVSVFVWIVAFFLLFVSMPRRWE